MRLIPWTSRRGSEQLWHRKMRNLTEYKESVCFRCLLGKELINNSQHATLEPPQGRQR
jgi:hypothetical protein